MKLYKAQIYDSGLGAILSWHPSREAAERWVRENQPPDKCGPCGVTKYEIRDTKAGLISWLNIHFTTDNG